MDEHIKHNIDIAAIGLGAATAGIAWTDLAAQATVWVTLIGAVLSTLWVAWRLYDRWRYGPVQLRGKHDA